MAQPVVRIAALAALAALSLSSCTASRSAAGSSQAARSVTSPRTAPTDSAGPPSAVSSTTPAAGATATGGAVVPGAVAAKAAQIRAQITIPPLPGFAIPTDVLTSAAGRHIASVLHAQPGLYAGIAVLDDRCTTSGSGPSDAGPARPARTAAASYDAGGVHVFVAGDGTGTYRDGPLSLSVLAGGAGVYDDGSTRVQVQPGGAGSFVSPTRRVTVAADGTGTYRGGGTRLWVNADHSAGYDAGAVHVSVSATGVVFSNGDAVTTAAVLDVLRKPFPRFPPVPRVARAQPTGSVCGTVVRLDANVLFGFGSATLSTPGTALVDRVGRLLSALGHPTAAVNGYTDHIGSSQANTALSRARAAVVCAALRTSGVPGTTLRAYGFGELHPLGPEVTAAGKDDPAARQLDRRVEVVLPSTAAGAAAASGHGGSGAPCG